MNTLMKIITPPVVALMLPISTGIAAESSTVATAQENIVVYTTGQVTLILAPSTSILASTYQSNTRLAGWEASATAGTIAFRLNPTIMKTSTSPVIGIATSTTNSTNTIPVQMLNYPDCIQNVDSGWARCQQGINSVKGIISTRNSQTIPVGTYPISVDAAIWQF
ncbi:TPA: hypothetical protein O8L60_004595 [Enterobacter cloacae]|nr:hypothetical protein [Enterobacter cloacae]